MAVTKLFVFLKYQIKIKPDGIQMDRIHRILIVDDERYNIKVLAEFLHTDYKIMAAKDGEHALRAALGSDPPDLILLDIIMPGMDGYEVCKRLKKNDKTKNIPIIFVTAVSEEMDAARGFELGAVDYVTKPLNPLTVRARIKTHIKLHSTMRGLKDALKEVKTLSGLLPICSYCKKIRDDQGYWKQIEGYIQERSNARFSHGICQECARKHFPDLDI